MDIERNEFHKYLQTSGAITSLSRNLLNLLQLDKRPKNVINFFRENIGEKSAIEFENNQLKALLNVKLVYLRKLELRLLSGDFEDLTDDEKREKTLVCFRMIENDRQCQSFLKKYLTEDVLFESIDLSTPIYNSKLYDCARAGFIDRRVQLSIFASDSDCYDIFHQIFHPIISDIHFQLDANFKHPAENWGNADQLPELKCDYLTIEKCQINCSRSLKGFPFHPKMAESDFESVFNEVQNGFKKSQIRGEFISIDSKNIDESCRFEQNDVASKLSGSRRCWPKGRGIFISDDKLFTAHINNQNHLKMGCTNEENYLKIMYGTLSEYYRQLDQHLDFVSHSIYGHVNSSLDIMGNALQIAVVVKLVSTAIEIDEVMELLDENDLRLSHFITDKNHQIYLEIRNKSCLGLSEISCMENLIKGISNLGEILSKNNDNLV